MITISLGQCQLVRLTNSVQYLGNSAFASPKYVGFGLASGKQLTVGPFAVLLDWSWVHANWPSKCWSQHLVDLSLARMPEAACDKPRYLIWTALTRDAQNSRAPDCRTAASTKISLIFAKRAGSYCIISPHLAVLRIIHVAHHVERYLSHGWPQKTLLEPKSCLYLWTESRCRRARHPCSRWARYPTWNTLDMTRIRNGTGGIEFALGTLIAIFLWLTVGLWQHLYTVPRPLAWFPWSRNWSVASFSIACLSWRIIVYIYFEKWAVRAHSIFRKLFQHPRHWNWHPLWASHTDLEAFLVE